VTLVDISLRRSSDLDADDVPGRSGNTLKVPGSRPGRPTKIPERYAHAPNGRDTDNWKEINGSGPPIRSRHLKTVAIHNLQTRELLWSGHEEEMVSILPQD